MSSTRISHLNIVLTSVSLTIIWVTAVFWGIAPWLDFGTVLERILVSSWSATDGTVKNADKVDGLHASDILSAASSAGWDYLIGEFEFISNQGCPTGWSFISTWITSSSNKPMICYRNMNVELSWGVSTDTDGDGINDAFGFSYTKKFNPDIATMDIVGLDLDSTTPDTSAQKSGTILFLATGSAAYTNRATMDAFCVTNKPINKTLTNVHAFVSFSPTDEIRDMPQNYGYNAYKPIIMMSSSWYITDSRLTTSQHIIPNWQTLLQPQVGSCTYIPIPSGFWWIPDWSATQYVWTWHPNSSDCLSYWAAGAGTWFANIWQLTDPPRGYSYTQSVFYYWETSTWSLYRVLCAAEVQN